VSERRIGVRAFVAGCVFAASTSAARHRQVSAAEERVFRRINSAPDWLHVVLWPVMQMGSLGAVFASAAIVRKRDRDARTSAIVAAVGTAVWGGIKLVKPLIGRGRPEHHLVGVKVRGAEQSGLGFPSGHAAVSMALALMATRPGPARSMAVGAATVTGMSRIFVAAHLPLDVLAGASAGWLAGTVGGRMIPRERCPIR
jgi:membrane-associated phospholipid phosphatase